MSPTMNAICFGELLIDMVSPAPDASIGKAREWVKAPGGAPANVAVCLQRLGAQTEFWGAVGDDPFGEFLRETVGAEGVNVSRLQTRPERTTIAFVATRADGKKEICFYRNPGADAHFDVAAISDDAFAAADIFHCGSVSLSLEPCRSAQFELARRAREAGALVSFDPNWRPSLWDDFELARDLIWQMMPLADIVKVADEEWEFVCGTPDFAEGAQKIRDAGARLVMMTRGAAGAAWNCAAGQNYVSGVSVSAIDTLGAGDAFVAGMLAEIGAAPSLDAVLNAENLNQITRFANACGALATQSAGAIPGLPTRAQVESLLNV